MSKGREFVNEVLSVGGFMNQVLKHMEDTGFGRLTQVCRTKSINE